MMYIKHNSFMFKLPARGLVTGLYVLVVVNFFAPWAMNLGWILPMLIYYFERESSFVKFHGAYLVLLELIRGFGFLFLSLVSIVGDFPFFTGSVEEGTLKLAAMGYVDLAFQLSMLVLVILGLSAAFKYRTMSGKLVNAVWYLLDKDPQFERMRQSYRLL